MSISEEHWTRCPHLIRSANTKPDVSTLALALTQAAQPTPSISASNSKESAESFQELLQQLPVFLLTRKKTSPTLILPDINYSHLTLAKALQKKEYRPCKGRSDWGLEQVRRVLMVLAISGLSEGDTDEL